MKQSNLDPCLFIGDAVISVMYVDGILMWSTEESHMLELGTNLRRIRVDIEEENGCAGFLMVNL